MLPEMLELEIVIRSWEEVISHVSKEALIAFRVSTRLCKYNNNNEECHKHRLAMRIFKGLERDEIGEECECCERRVGIEDESAVCCYDNIKLAALGPGVPLLFAFTKNSIIFLILLAITFVGFALYSNISSGYCTTLDNCSNNFLDSFSIFNKSSNDGFLAIQNYTVLTFCFLSILILQYFRYNFRKIEDECDGKINTPSDYAIILRRLPDGTTKRDIEYMIENRRISLNEEELSKTDNLKVDHIVMSFSMTEYNKIKTENYEEFHKLLAEEKHLEFNPKPLPKLNQPASLAIVIFSKQESKEYFRYKANILQNILQCFVSVCVPLSNFEVKGERIAVERAPEPDDIIWKNSKISMGGAMIRKLIYNSLAILLLGTGYAVQYGLAVAKNKISQEETAQLIMSTVFSITVSILNFVIQIFLGFTSQRQRTETLTEFNNILMVKISVFQFLNTGVFVVLAQFMANMDNFSLNGGIVFEITQVMLINAILPNVTLFALSYFEILKKIERYLIKSEFLKRSQLEANYSFEGPEVEFPFKYAYVFKTLWLSAFYAPISPVIVPISILGLILNYFLEKFLFSHSYATPNMTSSIMNDSAVEMMEYAILALPIGSYIIYLYFYSFRPDSLPTYWSVPLYVSMGIAVLNLMLPMDTLNKKLFKIKNDYEVSPTYDQIQTKFEVTYEMTNPGYICKKKRKRDLFSVSQASEEGTPLVDITGVRLLANSNLQSSLVEQQDKIYENAENNERSATKREKENQSNSFIIPETSNSEDKCKSQSFINETNKTGQCKKLEGVPPKFIESDEKDNECNISIIVENEKNEIIMEGSFHDEYGIRDDSNTIWYNVRDGEERKHLAQELGSTKLILPEEHQKEEKLHGSKMENTENIPILQITEEEDIHIDVEQSISETENDLQVQIKTDEVFKCEEVQELKSEQICHLVYEEKDTKLEEKAPKVDKPKEMSKPTNEYENIEISNEQMGGEVEENKYIGKMVEEPETTLNSVLDNTSENIEKQKMPASLINIQNITEMLLEEEWISERSETLEQNEEIFNIEKPFLLNDTNTAYPNQVMPVPIGRLLSKEVFELIHKKEEQNNLTYSSQDSHIPQTEISSPNENIKSSKKKSSFFSSKFKEFAWKPQSEKIDFDFNEQMNGKTKFGSLTNVAQPPPISIVQESENYQNSRERRKALRIENMKKLPFTSIVFKEY